MERKKLWVCQACGKSAATRMEVGDESCYRYSVQVWADTVECDERGLVTIAEPVPKSERE